MRWQIRTKGGALAVDIYESYEEAFFIALSAPLAYATGVLEIVPLTNTKEPEHDQDQAT